MQLFTWFSISSTSCLTYGFNSIKKYLFQQIGLLNVLDQHLLIRHQFLLHVLAILRGLPVKILVLMLDGIDVFAEFFHVVHEDDDGGFELLGEVADSGVLEHVHFVDFDVLETFGVDARAEGLDCGLDMVPIGEIHLDGVHLLELGLVAAKDWIILLCLLRLVASKDVDALLGLLLLAAEDVPSLLLLRLLLLPTKNIDTLLLLRLLLLTPEDRSLLLASHRLLLLPTSEDVGPLLV